MKLKAPLAEKMPVQSEGAPHKLRLKRELMRESHRQAFAAYNLEKIILERPDIDYADAEYDPEIKQWLEAIPRNKMAHADFIRVLNEYVDQRQGAKAKMRRVYEIFGKEGASTPDTLGKVFFEKMTKRPPEGKVIFKQEEAYFVIVCENPNDYAYVNEHYVIREGIPSVPNFPKAALAGGSFHGYIYVDLGGGFENLPIILARKDDDKEIVAHERQHFINHKLFDLFYYTEPTPTDEEVEGAERGRKIKDEILAYIRDGSDGLDMEAALSGKLYEHLFKEMPPEEEKKCKSIISEIADFLHAHGKKIGDEGRAILTYQLAGIRLSRIPAWLSAIEVERFKMLKPFRAIDRASRENGLFLLESETFPEKLFLGGEQYSLGRKLNNLNYTYGLAGNLAFDYEKDIDDAEERIKKILAIYKTQAESAQKEFESMKRNGILPPHASPAQAEYGDGRTKASGYAEVLYTADIKKAVLDVVVDFSQEKIEKIWEYLNGNAERPREIADLSILIEGAVFKENGGRKCEVSFSLSDDFGGTMIASVDFQVSPKDEEKTKIEGASFTVSFHRQKK